MTRTAFPTGITYEYGMLIIVAPKPSGNHLWIKPSGSKISVNLNGTITTYDYATTNYIQYTGGKGGNDAYRNDTTINDTVVMYGGNNAVHGSYTFTSVSLWGNGNSFEGRGNGAFIWEFVPPNGTPPTITGVGKNYVSTQTYDPSQSP